MSMFVRRQRRGLAALLVLSLVIAVLAAVHRGVPAADLDLNDGGVWVTNESLRRVGHLNYPSRTIDGDLRTGSPSFDIGQSGNTVLLSDTGAKKAQNIDPALLSLGDAATMPESVELIQGGTRAAAVDSPAGKVWTMPATAVGGFSPAADPALADVHGARAVIGTDGTTHVVLPDGRLKTIDAAGVVKDAGRIEGLADLASAALSVVGDTVVVLDKASASVRTAQGSVALPGVDQLQLQQPGPANDRALLAGPDSYLWAPLGGGTATTIPSGGERGTPVQPVYLGDCAYLAWSGSGQYVRDCARDADDRAQVHDKITSATRLAFRVNRDVIVLNDLANGLVLLPNDGMAVVDQWPQLTESEDADDDTDQEPVETVPDANPEQRKEEQTAPVAVDDDFGARPGASVTLPVLANDSDADGDVLTASVVRQPAGATVVAAQGGAALSIQLPADASGLYVFTYAASDGRGGRAEATVRVTVYPAAENDEVPRPLRPSTVLLGERGQVSYSVLGDWIDPQGDALVLESALAPEGLAVQSRPDGVVVVKDLGTGGPGRKSVTVTVSDGSTRAQGVLDVLVKGGENLPPIANSDHVTVLKGADVIVKPLANDVDPNGDDLRLTNVATAEPGQRIVPDYAAGTFVFSAAAPGSYYIAYGVTDGPSAAVTGYVRADVIEPVGDAPPVAGEDIAMLPEGGTLVLDVLANDTDPSGGVLVIQRVDVPAASHGLAVELIDHGLLRLSAPAGIAEPIVFGYTVANAAGTATGQVRVVPRPATSAPPPPQATDDRAVVRAGDIVTIPVLTNDRSPAALPLTLDPALTVVAGASLGDAFVSRDAVRIRATHPGTMRLAYTVRDSAGNYDSAEVVVTVTDLQATNSPPQPRPLTARVLTGSSVSIPIPTDGIDPDGDSVTLVGVASAPVLGTAVATATAIEYTAPAGGMTGTDTFSYEVADRYGVKASSTINVGVAAANTTNLAPQAVPDDVSARPGRNLTINVIANDVDPDGDVLTLTRQDAVTPADAETTTPASTAGGLLELTTPDHPATLRYYYEVSDGHGGTAQGVATIRVTPDAALRFPVALDDVVSASAVNGKKTIDVDVTANDYDPDGSVKELVVSSEEPGVSVSGSTVTVPVTDQRQVLLYTVTDTDRQSSRAAIVVPPANAVAPYLRSDKIPAKVAAGEVLTVSLRDIVAVRDGHNPRLTFENTVKAGPGADSPKVVDATTIEFRTAPEYAGLSSLTFEVTDGTSADDPDGLRATLTLPIEVEPTGRHQPVFTPSQVTAAAGEPATRVDLKPMVTDPDPGDLDKLAFSLGAVDGDFTVRLSGSVLEVTAPATMSAGATGSVAVEVTDGTTEPVRASIPLVATASTRPLPAVTTAVIDEVSAGGATTIDLNRYVTNPFAAEGKPLTLVGQPQITAGEGTVTANGMVVTITPAESFHGQLTVSYTVADATGDPSRYVHGTITVNVRARPAAPTAVTAESHLSKTATVNWTAGANNGAPITSFTVYWSGGSKNCGAVTSCTIDTLTNNQAYTFQVSATNAVGESDRSAPSNEVRPDVRPDPPGVPVTTFGDKQIALSWAASSTEGSPVTGYTVQISPAAGGVSQQTVTGTSLTWTGLANGTSYTFQVQAHSSASEPSEWSPASKAEVPVGAPAVPASPQVTKNPVTALAPSATVTWSAPNGNGDANLTYELRRSGSSTVLYTGTGTSATVTMSVEASDQTFEVRAQNKAGWSDWSAASNGVRGWQVPGAVSGLAVTATGQNNAVKIGFGAAAGNGAQASEIQYYWSAGGTTQSIPAGGGTVTNAVFANGKAIDVQVYARSTVNGESAQGAVVSAAVTAYGPPTSPTMTCTASGTSITCTWSGGSDNGRTTSYQLTGDATGDNAGASGNRTFSSVGYSTTRRLCIQARQDGGATGAVNCASATTAAAPAPAAKVTVTKGAAVYVPGACTDASCAYVRVTTANFPASVSCTIAGGWASSWTQGANETKQTSAYYGYRGTPLSVTCTGGGKSATGTITWS